MHNEHPVVQLLAAQAPGRLYGVLDGARDHRIREWVGRHERGVCSLYEPVNHALAPWGPWLVDLHALAAEVMPLLLDGWGQRHAIYLRSQTDLADARRHLRRLLRIELSAGRRAYFRFYDPGVLRVFLPTCTAAERVEFFGEATSMWAESKDGARALEFSRDPDAPRSPA